jgi:hypothetical protein
MKVKVAEENQVDAAVSGVERFLRLPLEVRVDLAHLVLHVANNGVV